MNITEKTLATKTCTEILQSRKQSNLALKIWPSHNVVIERLDRRDLELQDSYFDLYQKLHMHPNALNSFFGALLDAVALWGPEKIAKARAARDELKRINQKIAEISADLASLTRRRTELHNTSGFHSNTTYCIAKLLNKAGQYNGHFTMFLANELSALQARYDLKYWPSVDAFCDAMAMDASMAEVEASDPITKSATEKTKPSLTDFFKAWFETLDEHRVAEGGVIPDNFRLSDSSLAALANCALDLTDNDLVDGHYVKRLRQRLRNSTHHKTAL